MTKLGRAGEAAAWAISGVAWALSFAAQMELVAAHGFLSWEVWAWPATTDLAGLTGMLVALDQTRRHGSTVVAWLIAIAAAAVMVAANIGAAVGDPIAMLLHAWPPSIALACWYLLVHVRGMAATMADIRPAKTAPSAQTKPGRAGRSARGRVDRLVKRYGADISAAEVARRTGLSERHAARVLSDMRRPRVMPEEVDRPSA